MNQIDLKNIPKPIIDVLANRGIVGEAELKEYFSNSPKLTYDPFLLKNMEAGVDLILNNIDNKEKILIYGDYDTDGITSTALMLKFLGKLTDNLEYYIPSRFDEGYGLNKGAIDKINKMGAKLLITVDCGSVSKTEVDYAKSLGIETVITDHHTIGETIASGIVINPKQQGDDYPFKDLAGVGVAYKLAQSIQRTLKLHKSTITELLDLVAIGTIGDMVSLTDENRTLVKYGLRLIKAGDCNVGMKKLLDKSSIDIKKVDSKEISYGIVPKLNATGRLSNASIGLELLLATKSDDIDRLSDKLIEINAKRKKLQDDVYKKCIDIVNKEHKKDEFLLIDAKDAHEGITGIVAGKIKEYFNKPTIIVTDNSGYIKGTGRSIIGVNLYEMLNNHRELFVRFGGHKAACGFMANRESLEDIRKLLNEDMRNILKNNPNISELGKREDLVININEISLELVDAIKLMEPLGSGNPAPVFKIPKAKLNNFRFMGNDDIHMKFMAHDEEDLELQCIMFGKAKEYGDSMVNCSWANLIGALDINEWNNRVSIQMKIIDARCEV